MKRMRLVNIFYNKNIFYYSIYWTLYLLFFTFQRFTAMRVNYLTHVDEQAIDTLKESFFTNLTYLPFVILSTHFVVNFILPKFYFTNRFYLFSFSLGGTILAYPVFAYIVRINIIEPIIIKEYSLYTLANYLMAMLIFVFGMAPLAWFRIAKHLRVNTLNHQKIERDKLEAELNLREAELKLLKVQIHPHFLFNTLNNLYSLSIQKSEKTSEVIIKVSDLLNYIIYDCRNEKVSLVKEIEFINSYIELEKIRYDETLKLSISISGDFKNKNIAPMILHTFIENSFKHGASKTTDNPWIDIYLTVNNEYLTFKVANNKAIDSGISNSGIGINNAKKRLKLLYPDKHKLEINESENVYNVFLEIQL